MGRLVAVLAVTQQVLSLYYSFGFPHYHHGISNSEPVSVHNVYSTRSPMKPIDGHMPNELHFQVGRKYKKGINLRLKRWDNQEQLAPLYRLKHGRLEQIQLPDMSSSASLYQGKHDNDVFFVQASANSSNSNFSLFQYWSCTPRWVLSPEKGSRALKYSPHRDDILVWGRERSLYSNCTPINASASQRGVFWKEGKQYELTPSPVGYANVAYTVRELEQMSYVDDMLYPPADVKFQYRSCTPRRFPRSKKGRTAVCHSSRGDGTLVPDGKIYINLTQIDAGHRRSERQYAVPNVGKTTAAPRVRRQATGVRYVELAVLTDYQLYLRFLKFANGNAGQAQSEMTQYYRYVVASMDRRYQTITDYFPKLKVRVIMTSLTICDDPAECAWSKNNVIPSTEKISYGNALSQFRDFVLSANSPKGDHRMFITGYQMAKPDGTTGNIVPDTIVKQTHSQESGQGISYVGSMCGDWSVSMIQERYSGATSGVAAHELGHSLGSFHDDNKAYTGCANQNYVMNAIASFPTTSDLASRPYHFSSCSANSIAEYFKGTKASCTNNQPSSPDDKTPPAGQHFNADAQCAVYNGVGSKFCRKEQKERGFETMCTRMACSLPSNPASCSDIVPLDRTSCGDAQWCVDNICVSDAGAPKYPKDCPQGDDPTAGCAVDKCKGDANNLVVCCQTCSNVK